MSTPFSMKVSEGFNSAPERIIVYGTPGIGKAQPLDAKVLTPTGYKPIGEIRVGDLVIGSNGSPCTVTGVFPQGKLPIFEVITNDGCVTRCSEDHLWFVRTQNDAKNGKLGTVMSLGQMLKSSPEWYMRHQLPIVGSVDFASANLPMHPYLLGALLGDGVLGGSAGADSISFHKPEDDVMKFVTERLPVGDTAVRVDGDAHCSFLRIKRSQKNNEPSETKKILAELGLLGTDSRTKFVPKQYLIASIEQRLDLLRGLFDTDGWVWESGNGVEYTTGSDRLADAVEFLARSLGGLVFRKQRETHYVKDGVRVDCGPAWRMQVMFPNSEVTPVASVKHLEKWNGSPRRARTILSISHVGEGECVCIRVDAPDQLYVTDDFIVTHNSTLAASAPKPFFLDLDRGSGRLDVARNDVPIDDWNTLFEALKWVLDTKHSYQTLVIDTLDRAEWLCWQYLCKTNRNKQGNIEPVERIGEYGGGYNAGYNEAYAEFRKLFTLLEQIWQKRQMRIIILAHAALENVKNPKGPDYERYSLKVHKKVAGLFWEVCDMALFAQKEITVVKDPNDKRRHRGVSGDTEKRLLYTTETATHIAKNRDNLPPTLPLSWDELVVAIARGGSPNLLRETIREQAEACPSADLKNTVLEALQRAGTDKTKLLQLKGWFGVQLKAIEDEQDRLEEEAEKAVAAAQVAANAAAGEAARAAAQQGNGSAGTQASGQDVPKQEGA